MKEGGNNFKNQPAANDNYGPGENPFLARIREKKLYLNQEIGSPLSDLFKAVGDFIVEVGPSESEKDQIAFPLLEINALITLHNESLVLPEKLPVFESESGLIDELNKIKEKINTLFDGGQADSSLDVPKIILMIEGIRDMLGLLVYAHVPGKKNNVIISSEAIRLVQRYLFILKIKLQREIATISAKKVVSISTNGDQNRETTIPTEGVASLTEIKQAVDAYLTRALYQFDKNSPELWSFNEMRNLDNALGLIAQIPIYEGMDNKLFYVIQVAQDARKHLSRYTSNRVSAFFYSTIDIFGYTRWKGVREGIDALQAFGSYMAKLKDGASHLREVPKQ